MIIVIGSIYKKSNFLYSRFIVPPDDYVIKPKYGSIPRWQNGMLMPLGFGPVL